MTYFLSNGKTINIPDEDLDRISRGLGVSRSEAIGIWLEDAEYEINEEQEALDKIASKVKINHDAEAHKRGRKKGIPRTVKVSDEKKELFSTILQNLDRTDGVYRSDIEVLKENKLIRVRIGDKSFKIDIIEERKAREQVQNLLKTTRKLLNLVVFPRPARKTACYFIIFYKKLLTFTAKSIIITTEREVNNMKYVTDDGQEFFNYEEAKAHEKEISKKLYEVNFNVNAIINLRVMASSKELAIKEALSIYNIEDLFNIVTGSENNFQVECLEDDTEE